MSAIRCENCQYRIVVERIAKILEYIPGINDERDSVPILLAIKAEMEKLNA